MKVVIILTKKSRNNERLLIIENIDKIAIAKVGKVLNTINLVSKHSLAISNGDMDIVEDSLPKFKTI